MSKYLKCSACGLVDKSEPAQWNGDSVVAFAHTGTSVKMRCGDCCQPPGVMATLCRYCCPSGHGTRYPEYAS